MGSVRRRADSDGRPGAWLARWREPDGTQRKRSFTRKQDAIDHLTTVEGAKLAGTYVRPVKAPTWNEWWTVFRESRGALRPSTLARYDGLNRTYLSPEFGAWPIDRIGHDKVAAWVGRLSAQPRPAASTIRQAHRVLSLGLGFAVRSGKLRSNPADGITVKASPARPTHALDGPQLAALADAAGSHGLEIRVLGLTGIRFGELAALRVGDVDPRRRRITVRASTTEVAGRLTTGPTKTHAIRTVAYPASLAPALAGQCLGKAPGDWLFTAPGGGQLRIGNWRRRVFDPAVAAAGLPRVTPHDLRHTAASLAIRGGATIKDVQRQLGHATATMTLDRYGHHFEDHLDDVADRLDALVPQGRPMAAGGGGAVRRLRA